MCLASCRAMCLGTLLGGVMPFDVTAQAAEAPPRPNVIFILADDLGIADIGPYGQATIETPSLDALAAGGMVFSNMYSGAPVCSPSRAVLASGMHNGRFNNGNGVQIPQGMPTTASTLRDAGYETGLFGKLHLGGPNALWGFDEFYGLTDGVEAWDHFNPWLQRGVAGADGRIRSIVQEDINGAYTDDEIAFETMRFVRDHANGDAPFFAQLSFQIAHFDLEVPEIEPYAAALDVPLQEQIHASMVTRMDRRIGELLTTLDDPNGDGDPADSVRNNTIIMFGSDNGAAIEGGDLQRGTGPHDPETFDSNGIYRGHKRDLYNGGILSPFLVSWADEITPGSTSDRFGDFSDVLPTLADLSGADTPLGVDGQSLADVLTGDAPDVPGTRQDQYFEFTGGFFTNGATGDVVGPSTLVPPRHALIRDGFKAILFNDGSIELYDLANDPGETNNVFAQQPALATEMISTALSQNTGPTAYEAWDGSDGFADEAFPWSLGSAPRRNAIVTIGSGEVVVASNTDWLAAKIGGDGAASLNVGGGTLVAQNGLRVEANGDLHLQQRNVFTNRALTLRGGSLSGEGVVSGQVVNGGTVSPDRDVRALPPRDEAATVLRFDFAGVQDDAPLTQTSVLDPSLQVVAGLDFGLGTQPRSAGPDGLTSTDRGNEFNIGGFDTASLSGAIANQDYLGYTVQPVAGLTMSLAAVSFELWRNGGNAANDYAILTSFDGFTPGSELAQLNNVFDSGAGSARVFRGVNTSGTATTGPVEVRLYAWNANDSLASTHITDVTMQASFALEAGSSLEIADANANIAFENPYGTLQIIGDYHQLVGGELVLDVDGVTPGLNADRLSVFGDATLAGALMLRTDAGYTPILGERVLLVEASGELTGTFDAASGVVQAGFAWAVLYDGAAVWAEAALLGDANLNQQVEQGDLNAVLNHWGLSGQTWSTGDFNGDGSVDQTDLNAVLNHWGASAAPSFAGSNVPEPAAALALVIGGAALGRRRVAA